MGTPAHIRAPLLARSFLFKYRTFVKYCVVGSFVTLIDFLVFSLAFYRLALNAVPSKLIAFSAAVVVSYTCNRAWTFRSGNPHIWRQFSRFLFVSIVGAALSAVAIYTLIDLLNGHPLIANGITSALVLSWNFLANKYWTFRILARQTVSPEQPTLDLSLVIPAYNEENRLGPTLKEYIAYLSEKTFSWEIIVVDDGSHDQTANIARKFESRSHNTVRVLRVPRNRGKGAAVQFGVVNARGRLILIADADNATPIDELDSFLCEAMHGEILIGSRYLKSSVIERTQSRGRVLIGRLGNMLIRLSLVNGIVDTQCGFKLFPFHVARLLFSRQRMSGWGFDMEILSIAQSMGIPIREKGVKWRDVPGSRLRPIRAAFRTLVELARIKINLWSGIYD